MKFDDETLEAINNIWKGIKYGLIAVIFYILYGTIKGMVYDRTLIFISFLLGISVRVGVHLWPLLRKEKLKESKKENISKESKSFKFGFMIGKFIIKSGKIAYKIAKKMDDGINAQETKERANNSKS